MFSKEWDRLVTVSHEKRQEARNQHQKTGMSDKMKYTVSEFTKRTSLLPVALLATVFLFQQLSGTYPIIFYAVQVFQSIGGNFGAGLDADSATIMLGIIRFVCSLLTAGLSHTYGRRLLLVVSGIGMAVSSFVAAIYFHQSCVFNSVFNKSEMPSNFSSINSFVNISLFESNTTLPLTNSTSSNLIGLICILLFVSMSSIGFLTIPWTLVGEILPLSVRGIGGGLIFSYAYILMFFIVKIFPFMLDIFHISGMFYFFSFTSFINVVVVYFFLPETLGKSFEEIEKFFTK